MAQWQPYKHQAQLFLITTLSNIILTIILPNAINVEHLLSERWEFGACHFLCPSDLILSNTHGGGGS